MSELRGKSRKLPVKFLILTAIVLAFFVSVLLLVVVWKAETESYIEGHKLLKYSIIVFFMLFLMVALRLPIHSLREKHAAHVDMMFYFLSLSFVATLVVVIGAIKLNIIDVAADKFNGEAGEFLEKALHFVTNVNDGFYVGFLILSVTLGPQILGYIFSGIFQCASGILFASEIIELTFWLAVKPFITFSGVVLATSIVVYSVGFPGFEITALLKASFISASAIFSAFWMVWMYEELKKLFLDDDNQHKVQNSDVTEAPVLAEETLPVVDGALTKKGWRKWALRVHEYATKYNKKGSDVWVARRLKKLFGIDDEPDFSLNEASARPSCPFLYCAEANSMDGGVQCGLRNFVGERDNLNDAVVRPSEPI